MAGLLITLLILGGLLLVAMFRVRNQPLTSLTGTVLNYQPGPALQRIYGLLLSPGKGLFLYSPVLLASVIGFWRFRHRRPAEAFIAGGSLLALLGLYSSLLDWYGGVAWGPRFLVPVIPLLALPLAEVFASRRKIVMAGAAALALLSLAVQVAASTATWTEYYDRLATRFPQPERTVGLDMRQLRRSPVLGQFRIWSPATLDLVWWHVQPEDGIMVMDRRLLAVLGLSVALSGVYLTVGLRPRMAGKLSPIYTRWQAALTVLTLIGLAAGTIALLVRAADGVQGYAGIRLSDVRQIAARVGDGGGMPYTLITVSNEFGFHLIKGYLKGRFTHYWFSPYQREGFEPVLTSAEEVQRLWLVVDRGHMPPDASGRDLEYWLNTHAYQLSGEWVQDYEVLGYALLLVAQGRAWGISPSGSRIMRCSVTPCRWENSPCDRSRTPGAMASRSWVWLRKARRFSPARCCGWSSILPAPALWPVKAISSCTWSQARVRSSAAMMGRLNTVLRRSPPGKRERSPGTGAL